MNRIVVMVPTYNERENIEKLLGEFLEIAKKMRKYRFVFLVVDDNSPDGTGEIVGEYVKKHKNIKLLSGKKEGLGRAMVRGYRFALKNLKPDVVVTNEADFGFSFGLLPKMLKKIEEGYDVVVASRHVGRGKSTGWTLSRKFNHWVANSVFAQMVAGVDIVKDKNGAMRAIRVGVLKKIDFSQFPRGFSFFFFQIYALSRVTDSFFEIPSIFVFRTRGESKVSFNPKYIRIYSRDVWEYIHLAFKIRLGYY